MSRGGRGGGRGGRGGMNRNPLPFEVDPELVDSAEGSLTDPSDENRAKQLFPPTELVAPSRITARERQQVAIRRELKARSVKSVWWTGTKKQAATMFGTKDQGKRGLDAFDSMETYSKRKRAKPDDFVPMDKRVFPKINAELTPAELMPGVGGGKKKSGAKKSVTDRLANLDESKDDEGGDADEESVDGGAKAGEDDDAASVPQDSDFEEDEADDADNDYNAENYFSGGEGDDRSIGGEEGDEGVFIDDEGNRCTTRRQKARALYRAGETLRLQEEEAEGEAEDDVESSLSSE